MGFSVSLCSITSIEKEKASAVQCKREEGFNHSSVPTILIFKNRILDLLFSSVAHGTHTGWIWIWEQNFGIKNVGNLQVPQWVFHLDWNNCSLKICHLHQLNAAKMVLVSVEQTDWKSILLLINGACKHSDILLFLKICLLLAVLWKNNACWSVSASACLLIVTWHELVYATLPSSSAAAETGLFLWPEVAPHPTLKVFWAIRLNKCSSGKEKVSSWAYHWHWKPGVFCLQLLCQVSLLRRAVFVLLSCSLMPKTPHFPVLQFLLSRRVNIAVRWLLLDRCHCVHCEDLMP